MLFDEINTKLLAVAEKGTQDTYFNPSGDKITDSKGNGIHRKLRYSSKNKASNQEKSGQTKERNQVQRIAQLTLFDLP
ncbi:MAG: hypothetical protein AB3N14_00360 [Flavobacteriaceae bacterium]